MNMLYQCKQGMFDDGCESCVSIINKKSCYHKNLHVYNKSCDRHPSCIPIKNHDDFLTESDMQI